MKPLFFDNMTLQCRFKSIDRNLGGKNMKNYFFTANTESVSKVEATNNQLIEEIAIDGMAHNVQISPDNKILGVTVMNHHHGMGKALFIDANTSEVLSTVELSEHPAHIDFTNDNKYAVVTSTSDDKVFVIDLADYTIKGTIETGKGPHGIRITQSGFAYVANMSEETISELDIENLQEVGKIKVGKSPVQTAITTDGKTVLVSLSETNELAIVDLDSKSVKKIAVGNSPIQMFIQSDDQFAFVANQGNKEEPGQTVSKINLYTKEIAATIKVGNGAHGVVIEQTDQFVYVTNMYDDTVSVIDTVTDKEIAVVKVGQNPNGITFQN